MVMKMSKYAVMDVRRERKILHNYMEFLALNYKNIEPAEMTSSICSLYKTLNSARERFYGYLAIFFGFEFCVGILIFIKKLFWS